MLTSYPLLHTSSIPPTFFTSQPSTLFPANVYRKDERALPGNLGAIKCFVVPHPSRNNNNNNNNTYCASHHQHPLTSAWLSLRTHCVKVSPVQVHWKFCICLATGKKRDVKTAMSAVWSDGCCVIWTLWNIAYILIIKRGSDICLFIAQCTPVPE